jgi:hypothetical protein
MTAASLQKEAEIESAVLKAAKPGQDYEPLDLVRRVVTIRVDAGWAEDMILRAIWRLISERKLILSHERMLRRS